MSNRTLIIAEAGVNHNGSLENAFKLIDKAVEACVDVVKFQTFKTEAIVTKTAEKASYQNKNDNSTNSQYEMLKELEFGLDEFKKIADYCNKKNIDFCSTAFDFESIDLLSNNFDMVFWKIPSGEITNLPYLEKIGKLGTLGKKIILSTGMSTVDEVDKALKVLLNVGVKNEDVTLLHCTTEYPATIAGVNLNAMKTLHDNFNCEIGYSDHTEGIEVAIAAVAMGASVIEKHFTLDKNMKGPDHKASLEPKELTSMVTAIRNIELALGNGVKEPLPIEMENRKVARKSIVAKKDILINEILTEDNLTVKRPGIGLSPMFWNDAIGSKSIRTFKKDELIEIN